MPYSTASVLEVPARRGPPLREGRPTEREVVPEQTLRRLQVRNVLLLECFQNSFQFIFRFLSSFQFLFNFASTFLRNVWKHIFQKHFPLRALWRVGDIFRDARLFDRISFANRFPSRRFSRNGWWPSRRNLGWRPGSSNLHNLLSYNQFNQHPQI